MALARPLPSSVTAPETLGIDMQRIDVHERLPRGAGGAPLAVTGDR